MARRIEGRGSIEVYVSQKGLITIKQEGYMGADDSLIELTPYDVPTLVKWLREAAKQAKDFVPESTEED